MSLRHNILALSLLIFASCETVDFPEANQSEPVFFVQGEINGNPINWGAGADGYFMNTEITQEGEFNYLTGWLAQEGCETNCANSLKISVLQDLIENNDPEQIFVPGDRDVGTNVKDQIFEIYVEDKSGCANNLEVGSQIMVNGSSIDLGQDYHTLDSREGMIEYTMSHPEIFHLSMRHDFIAQEGRIQLPRMSIKFRDNRLITLAVNEDDFVNINWSNGKTSSIIELEEIPDRVVTAEIVNANGETTIISIEFMKNDNQSAGVNCDLNLLAIIETNNLPENAPKSNTVLVDYTDGNGEVFTSVEANQTSDNIRFSILESDKYRVDEKGNETQLVKFVLDCNLKSKTSENEIEIRNLNGVFAFAY